MENIKEAIEGTLEDVNEAIVEIANDVDNFAAELSFSDLLDVGETLELVGTKLKEMKETKMEQMVEDDRIYLSNHTDEAEDCLVNGDCSRLGQLLKGQGL